MTKSNHFDLIGRRIKAETKINKFRISCVMDNPPKIKDHREKERKSANTKSTLSPGGYFYA